MLCDCSELCKLVRLTDSVYHQCESGDYGVSVQVGFLMEIRICQDFQRGILYPFVSTDKNLYNLGNHLK